MVNNTITATRFHSSPGISVRPLAECSDAALHHSRFVDLMQRRDLLSVRLDDTDIAVPSSACNPTAFSTPGALRCTLRSVPQTQKLLKKSCLPFGLILKPFGSTEDVDVIDVSTIVRCRCCRAYINPYIYLPDTRHWQCNLCQKLNELPDDFILNSRNKPLEKGALRPELRSGSVEFIASSEFTVRNAWNKLLSIVRGAATRDIRVAEDSMITLATPLFQAFTFRWMLRRVNKGYLSTFAEQMLQSLERMPSNERTLISILAVDAALHFFQFNEGASPRHIIVDDIQDPFIPVSSGLLVHLQDNMKVIAAFVQNLPLLFESNSSRSNCLGAALDVACELMQDFGGRITVIQTVLPNIGPSALASREDAHSEASLDGRTLRPSTDFYKNFALRCLDLEIAVDLFLLSTRYADLATLAEMAKFSGGTSYFYRGYDVNDEQLQQKRFEAQLADYLTHDIGFEAMLRIRCSEGIAPHSFYGNFFVRSIDLMVMGNVNPHSAIGVKLEMQDDFSTLSNVSFQAALVYTSSKGVRRVRVHTLCLPLTKDLLTVYSDFDAKCAITLLSKIASERLLGGGSLSDCQEAMTNSLADVLKAFNTAVVHQSHTSLLLSPGGSMRLLPLYILAMLKHRGFSIERTIRLDERVSALLLFRTASSEIVELELYPALYKLNQFTAGEEDPSRLHLSYEFIDPDGLYLLDVGSYVYIYVMAAVGQVLVKDLFGVDCFKEIDEQKELRPTENIFSQRVHNFIRKLSIQRAMLPPVLVIREDGSMRNTFIDRLIEDRTQLSQSYADFLHYLHHKVQ